MNIDKDVKSLLVAGDLEILNEFLREVYDITSQKLEKVVESDS